MLGMIEAKDWNITAVIQADEVRPLIAQVITHQRVVFARDFVDHNPKHRVGGRTWSGVL